MGDVSRRAVLGAGAGIAGLVSLGVSTVEADAAPPVAGAVPVRSHYTRALGRVFTARHGGRTYRLRLTGIHDLTHTTAKLRPHAFTLVFVPVGRVRVPDAIYLLHSHNVGAHRLFLSSIGTARGLQAVVNRRA